MNPYEVLGVRPDASDDEISRAYKTLAKRYHPDLNPDDAAAAVKMGQINRAYSDVRALRQRGQSYRQDTAGYDDPFGQFYSAWQAYESANYNRNRRYARRRPVSVSMVIAVTVMFFLVRLLLSLLFGGYGGGYTQSGWNGYYVPGYGYGYYQTIP